MRPGNRRNHCMKRLIAVMISALMMLSLAACGSTNTGTEQNSEKSAAAVSEPSEAAAEEAAEEETKESSAVSEDEESENEPQDSAEGFVPALDTQIEATINFVGSWGNFEALDQVAIDFQQYYPNVEVVYTKLDDYRNDLANRFATGEEIDLFMTDWWDIAYPANLNIAENAENLNGVGIDFSNIEADLLSAGEYNGAQVMVPVYMMNWGYMVNLDIFEAAGAEVPTTYDELLAACEKLAEAGYEQPIYVNTSQFARTFTGYYMEQRLAGNDENASLENTIAAIDGLVDTGYVSREGDDLEDNYNAIILKFFEGETPMVPISTNNFSGTQKREGKSEEFTAEPFSYAFIPAPYTETNSTFIDQLGSVYIGVYKDSQQIDLANEFLRFMLSDEEMTELKNIKNMPSSNIYNGLEGFTYLDAAERFYLDEEGISSLDEEYILNVLTLYGTENYHDEMLAKMNDYLENGFE